MAPTSADDSEASLLRAGLEAGLQAVLEQVERAGYTQMAQAMDTDQRLGIARRRRPSWAAE